MAVFLSRQARYDTAEIRGQLEDALGLIGAALHGRRAVIKPNLVNQHGPTHHTTTHPAVV